MGDINVLYRNTPLSGAEFSPLLRLIHSFNLYFLIHLHNWLL